jgi:hypothetical protein
VNLFKIFFTQLSEQLASVFLAFFLPNHKRLQEERLIFMPQVMTTDHERDLDLEQQILQAIKHVRYGSVEITIHDAKVVQIERKEKIRFTHDRTENKK